MPLPLLHPSEVSCQHWTPLVTVGDQSQRSRQMGDHTDHLVRGAVVRGWLVGGGKAYWHSHLWRGEGMALTPEGRCHSCGSDSTTQAKLMVWGLIQSWGQILSFLVAFHAARPALWAPLFHPIWGPDVYGRREFLFFWRLWVYRKMPSDSSVLFTCIL